MFVPIVPKTAVINKTIVYSDTVLPLKDVGSNLLITTIDNIYKWNIERCLQIIFESNPNIIFNTVQYSKENKKLYIYASDVISTTKWKESNTFNYNPLKESGDILREIKRALLFSTCKDESIISLYDIALALKKNNSEYEKMKDYYENKIDEIIMKEYGKNSSIVIYNFDYENEQLHIGFKRFKNFESIFLEKKNGDLYIVKSESIYAQDILTLVAQELTNLYDKFMLFKEIKNGKISILKSINSAFLVDVSFYGTAIFVKNPTNMYDEKFKIMMPSYSDKFNYKCNSSTIISAIKGKETEIFKKIYVKKEDLPIWCQTLLEKMQEENQKNKIETTNTEKVRKLACKIFPFLK